MDEHTRPLVGHYPAPLAETIRAYVARYPKERLGVNNAWDWNRLAFAAGLVQGRSVLDVGAGNGTLMAMLLRHGGYARVAGVDIRPNGMRKHLGEAELTLADVTELPFADGEFDTVVCMEVIEHLPVDKVPRALAQLRRVARRRLVLTIPYKEPHPLFHHDKPTGHKQSFDGPKLATLFPGAVGMRLPGPSRFDWLMLVEEPEAPAPRFTLERPAAFCRRYDCLPPYPLPAHGQMGRVGRVAARLPHPLGRVLERGAARIRERLK